MDRTRIVHEAQDAFALSPTTSRLVSTLSKPTWDRDDVIEIVAQDPVLVGKTLSIANSAWSAAAVPIETLADALPRVGAGMVLRLAIASTVAASAKGNLALYGYAEDDLWKRAVGACALLKVLPSISSQRVPDAAVTAALLRELGRVILDRWAASNDLDSPRLRLLTAEDPATRSTEVETAEFGIHHGELGAEIAQAWGLSEQIALSIRHYDDPSGLPDHEYFQALASCRAVHLADRACSVFVAGNSLDELADITDGMDYFGLTLASVQEWCEAAKPSFEALRAAASA